MTATVDDTNTLEGTKHNEASIVTPQLRKNTDTESASVVNFNNMPLEKEEEQQEEVEEERKSEEDADSASEKNDHDKKRRSKKASDKKSIKVARESLPERN